MLNLKNQLSVWKCAALSEARCELAPCAPEMERSGKMLLQVVGLKRQLKLFCSFVFFQFICYLLRGNCLLKST